MKKTSFILSFICLATGLLFADEPPAPDLGTLKYSGDQALMWRWGAYDPATRTGGQLDSKMSAEYSYKDFKLVGAAQIYYSEVIPGETALFWTPGPFKFGVGYQEFSWGVADKKNPTDTLNARDYRHDIDSPRKVNLAASMSFYPADWTSIDLVYEPWKEESKFPVDFQGTTQQSLTATATKTKASVSAYSALNPAYAPLSTLLNATYSPVATSATVDHDFKTPVMGLRTNFFLPGVDLAFSYVYDRDTYYSPLVTFQQFGGALWLPTKIDLVYKRIHRFGVDAKTTVDQFSFWVESAYNLTEDPTGTDNSVRDSSLSWTTGMDLSYGPGAIYYLNFQYAGEWIPGYDSSSLGTASLTTLMNQSAIRDYTYKSLTQSLGLQTEGLLHTFTLSMKWPLLDSMFTPTFDTVLMVPMNYDSSTTTRFCSAFFKPELDLMPADGLHFFMGSELAYAWVKDSSGNVTLDTTNDKLGVYTPQNNIYLKVQYKWNGSLAFH